MRTRTSSRGRERRREAWWDWALVMGAVHLPLVVLAIGPENPVIVVLATALLGIGLAMGGVIVLHHAAHRRFGRSWRANAVALHSAAPSGFWLRHWAAKHQVHHRVPAVYPDDAFTNVAAGILRFHPMAPLRPWHRYQPVYAWLVYALAWLGDLVSQLIFLHTGVVSGADQDERFPRVQSFLLEKAMAGVVLAPYVALAGDPARLLLCLAISLLLGGLVAACLVVVGHINVGIRTDPDLPSDWREHVLATTASFSTGSSLVSVFSGGLTLHAAHHLRPAGTRRELRDLHDQLQRARDPARPLIEFVTFRAALHGHVTTLKQLGSESADVPREHLKEIDGATR